MEIMDTRIKDYTDAYYNAMILWNTMLSDDKTMLNSGYAYANRALIFYDMRLYSQCLHNINLANVHNFPDNSIKVHKVLDPRHISSLIATFPKPMNWLKLSYKANPRLPFMIDSLKLRMNYQLKNYIISDRNLKIGDVIATERPFFTVSHHRDHKSDMIETDSTHQRCDHCFNHNYMDLLPCPGCDLGKIFISD